LVKQWQIVCRAATSHTVVLEVLVVEVVPVGREVDLLIRRDVDLALSLSSMYRVLSTHR